MSRLSFVAVMLFLMSPAVPAEIFKCVGEKGAVVYQNFRCELDSIGSYATAPAPPDATTNSPLEASAAPPNGPDQARSQPARVQVAAFEKSPPGKPEPRIGMTRRQVRHQSWGEPSEITKADDAQSQVEIWSYGDKRTIRFDDKGRVTSFRQ